MPERALEHPSDRSYYEGPTVFSRPYLARQEDLFRHRAALYFTPTKNLPDRHVGEGILDVRLPLAVPTLFQLSEVRGLAHPRLWVDLLQRATGKIRWRPMNPARLELHTYDADWWGTCNRSGAKGVIDALKRRTHGRSDRRWLHYFGAIEDDGPGFIEGADHIEHHDVEQHTDACCRVRVVPA